ncbi:hypothetical protein D9756_003624 [Leucocoprinus leucothites]|uniref:Uncharacterized protein n=1 Tax=Leucocoprinus leucothites TaxID=201217 RepID=A0A8H5G6M4_9AGAR|nr:hypothetical protein D9756_003624 [Leucoagaricus leucothites]
MPTYYIRSTLRPEYFWFFEPNTRQIGVSKVRQSRFMVQRAAALSYAVREEEDVLVGQDDVVLSVALSGGQGQRVKIVSDHGGKLVQANGHSSNGWFKFWLFENGFQAAYTGEEGPVVAVGPSSGRGGRMLYDYFSISVWAVITSYSLSNRFNRLRMTKREDAMYRGGRAMMLGASKVQQIPPDLEATGKTREGRISPSSRSSESINRDLVSLVGFGICAKYLTESHGILPGTRILKFVLKTSLVSMSYEGPLLFARCSKGVIPRSKQVDPGGGSYCTLA